MSSDLADRLTHHADIETAFRERGEPRRMRAGDIEARTRQSPLRRRADARGVDDGRAGSGHDPFDFQGRLGCGRIAVREHTGSAAGWARRCHVGENTVAGEDYIKTHTIKL